MTMNQKCKEDLESATNALKASQRKEIAQVKKAKDAEKEKELEAYDVKVKASCKKEKDGVRTDMLAQC